MRDCDLFLYMVQFPHLYLKEMAVKSNRHEHNFHILKILLLEQVSLQCQITCIKRGGGNRVLPQCELHYLNKQIIVHYRSNEYNL